MGNEAVQWKIEDGIGAITLNRPEKRNAINGEMLEGIQKAFAELAVNLEVRVILLQGAGVAFSAGIDFNYLATVARDDGRSPGIRLREGIDAIHTILNRIERIEKPVVAKIHGFCGGLGLELALTADFRFASENAGERPA
jgi:enoyl-CoA hydratase/carnithine racemase